MRDKLLRFCVMLLVCLAVSVGAHAQRPIQDVYVIPIQGEIDLGLSAFVKRGIASAERAGAVVLLEINTFGGLVEAGTEIRDAIIRSEVPVISYVADRAWSAGALIALAAPQ